MLLYMNENWSVEKLSYLAGIIDGEGSIHIEIQSQSIRHNRKCDYYSLRLLVVNTHLPMLEWIKSNFGGSLYTHHKKEPNKRQCYRWNLCSHNAARVLIACSPYMIIKKAHVAVFIEFASTMTHANWKLSDELLAHRKELYLKLKHINKTY
jgi:LAGLIDADG endonuclease